MSSTWFDEDSDEDDEAVTKHERLDQWVHNVNRISKGAEGGFEIMGDGLIFEDEVDEGVVRGPSSSDLVETLRFGLAYQPHSTRKGKMKPTHNCAIPRSSGWTVEIIPIHPGDNRRNLESGSSVVR